MKGERFTSRVPCAAFRCRAITADGSQCEEKARGFISFYAICQRHRNTLTKHLKPLSFIEV